MAKKSNLKCKKCRREGEKLFLKGERCFTPKCAMVRRNYPPGFHGPAGKKDISEFGLHMREKQKAKEIYGLREQQFKNYFKKAAKKKGVTGELLLQFLERRLDNVVFRLGFAKSRSQAKQIVNHGHIWVNGRVVNIPSYQVKSGDVVQVRKNSLKNSYFTNLIKTITKENIPKWLKLDLKNLRGEVIGLPTSKDVDRRINTQLIVEFYSK